MAAMAGDTVAIDLAQEGAWLTQRRLLLERRNGSALVADGEHLPFRDATFESAYSFTVIHHTDHPEFVIREMAPVLRPGGGS